MEYARRRSWRDHTTAVIVKGNDVDLPPVNIPSPPFLDESAAPAAFRKVTLMAAGITGGVSAATDWTLTMTITLQPTSTGPAGKFIVPAGTLATITNDLALIFDTVALPGASFQLNAALAAGAAGNDSITISYGALVAPSWIDVDAWSRQK